MMKIVVTPTLFICLLLPTVAFAEESHTNAATERSSNTLERDYDAAFDVQDVSEPQDDSSMPAARFGRVIAETFGGVLAASAGALVGTSLACASYEGSAICGLEPGTLATGVIAAVALQPLGIFAAGEIAGGNGNLGAAYIGELVAAVPAAGIFTLIMLADDDAGSWGGAELFGIVQMLAAPLIGGIGGYELSHKPEARSTRQKQTASATRSHNSSHTRPATSPRIHAAVVPTINSPGALLSLSGTF